MQILPGHSQEFIGCLIAKQQPDWRRQQWILQWPSQHPKSEQKTDVIKVLTAADCSPLAKDESSRWLTVIGDDICPQKLQILAAGIESSAGIESQQYPKSERTGALEGEPGSVTQWRCRLQCDRNGQLNPHLFQIKFGGEKLSPALRQQLSDLGWDYAITEQADVFQDVQFIISDMDSTFIQQEVIDEIGQEAGIKEQIAEITELAMQGQLDFSESLRRRVSLLKGVSQQRLNAIAQRLQVSEGMEDLLKACKQYSVAFALVSGGFQFFVEGFKQKYQLDFALANQLQFDEQERLTGELSGQIIDAKAKAQALRQFSKQLGIEQPSQEPNSTAMNRKLVLAMGDGANDIQMLQAADIGVAYRAKPALTAAADVHINHRGMRSVVDLLGLA